MTELYLLGYFVYLCLLYSELTSDFKRQSEKLNAEGRESLFGQGIFGFALWGVVGGFFFWWFLIFILIHERYFGKSKG
jgi:hypothetical protein